MQAQATPNTRADGFKPKWRHFHPNDRVWVKNPFDHDVVFQVADEYNRQFKYRLPKGKISELPGGAIATLGVKALVDELIQDNAEDSLLMWDERVRAKHEKSIIQDVRSTAPKADSEHPGEINLASNNNTVPQEEPEPETPPEEAFPGLNEEPEPEPQEEPPLPAPAAAGIDDVVAASLPSGDAVVGANNAGHDDA